MPDLIYLVVIIAFFAITVGFVRVCDRIIGPDAESLRSGSPSNLTDTEPSEVAPSLEKAR